MIKSMGSYKEYASEHELSLYSTKTVTIPWAELYVVYTGAKDDVPDVLRLSDLCSGPGIVEAGVQVLRGGDGSILPLCIKKLTEGGKTKNFLHPPLDPSPIFGTPNFFPTNRGKPKKSLAPEKSCAHGSAGEDEPPGSTYSPHALHPFPDGLQDIALQALSSSNGGALHFRIRFRFHPDCHVFSLPDTGEQHTTAGQQAGK